MHRAASMDSFATFSLAQPMDHTKPFTWVDIHRQRYTHDCDPEICPLCHHAVAARQLFWIATPRRQTPTLEIVFQCPRAECARLFIACYEAKIERLPGMASVGLFVLAEVVPQLPKLPEMPEVISTISPMFVEIFSEASAAECYSLNQVAGVGYRKALEFLIKDYCIHTRPADEPAIRKVLLGDCINRFVDDPKVQECARRAVWLGNDEAHYERKWADRDIEDLKTLITLTVLWIHSCDLTNRYMNDMS